MEPTLRALIIIRPDKILPVVIWMDRRGYKCRRGGRSIRSGTKELVGVQKAGFRIYYM